MRGTGFACDHCRTTAVDRLDVMPDGWFQIARRAGNPFGDDYEEVFLHLCGWSCVEGYALLSQPERAS